MRRVTLRSLWAHKRRLLSTVLAVVLGVSFMAGTFILSTTLDRSFNDLFEGVVEDADAVVQGELLYRDLLSGDQRANLPEGLVFQIAEVDGVERAEARVSTEGAVSVNRVVAADGEPLGGSQSTTVLESWLYDERINPYELTAGRPPEDEDELVLNVGAAEDGGVGVGDTVRLVSSADPREYEVVGTFSFGAAKSVGGAVTAAFTLAEAQRLAGLDAEVEAVLVQAEDGVAADALVADLRAELPGDDLEAVTGPEAAQQLASDSQNNLQFLEMALLIFGAIALLVGVFVISNTFSILVAQRTRELALLRALGASRGQVLASVLLEAGVVGAVASVLGIGGGVLMAQGATAVIRAAGAQLPSARLVIAPTTVLLALLIGVAVTLLAALLPAARATRVPPLAALRDVAIDRSDLSRARLVLGAVLVLLGAWWVSDSFRTDGNTDSIPVVGLGAGLTVVGFLVVGPVLAGRTVRVLGLPLRAWRGVVGRLATENAARSPRRTSATASAVLIGVALVVFITAFASSASRSVRSEVERGFKADFVVTNDSQGLNIQPGIPSGVAEVVRGVEGVDLTSALGFGSTRLTYPDGDTADQLLTAVEPETVLELLSPRMEEGEVSDLREDGVILDQGIVSDHDLELGDPITLQGPGGKSAELDLVGVSDDRNYLGLVAVSRTTFEQISDATVDVQVAGRIEPGTDLETVMADVEEAIAGFPAVQVLDREGMIGDLIDQISQFITLIQALLVLSIFTALIGVANTLSLSITERTRELGLLRAVGMDRADVRSTVHAEALLLSSLGALVGVSLGMVLSVALVKALKGLGLTDFAFPTVGLAVILLATAVLGTLAAVRPARRAAGLSILDAVAAE
jgi:putative ABC transport system permease protein